MQQSTQAAQGCAAAPSPAAQSVNTIIEALGDFFVDPTIANKVAAVLALQAHLATLEARMPYSGYPACNENGPSQH